MSSYRGMRALAAVLVALLALFCVVIVAQAPLAHALRTLRRAPFALSGADGITLAVAILAPLCCAAITYALAAAVIPVLRMGHYARRLHHMALRQMRQSTPPTLDLDLRAMRFAPGDAAGERVSLPWLIRRARGAPESLLLLGEGGTGKSTTLLRMAAEATRRRHILALCLGRPLPVMLSLAELSAHPGGVLTLGELVRRSVAPFATSGLLATLPDRLRAGRLLLLCDELEALPPPRRVALGDSLAAYMKAGGAVVASCRLDAYTAQPGALRGLDRLPRAVLEGVDPDALSAALRAHATRPHERHGQDPLDLLRAHQLDIWAALPAHLAELHDLAREGDGPPLPFGRAQAASRAIERATRRALGGDDLAAVLSALAASLLLARRPALPLPAGLTLGAVLEGWLVAHPPPRRETSAALALDATRLEVAARAALDAGLLRLAPDGSALRFANSVVQAQFAAYALAAGDDGFGWPAPELLGAVWVLPVILWSGQRDEPIDVTRRLLRLADTPDTTAMRAGLSLRDDVAPAIFALAIAALCDALAAQLAAAAGTNRDRGVTAQAEQQLRDLLDRVQVALADSANIPRLANALRQVERGAGPELTEALGFLVTHAPLSRLLRGEIATLLGLLATPRAIEIVIALLGDSDPLTQQAAAQALEWAGAPAVAALNGAQTAPDERLRARATELLARVGPGAEEGALAGLRAANPTRRLAATRTLASITTPRAEEALTERLADPDADVRRAAVAALGQLGTPSAVSALLRLITDPDPRLRIALCGALGALGAGGDEAVRAALTHLLDDEDGQVRAAAVAALSTIGDTRALAAVEARRDDPDPWVRNAVIQTRRRFEIE